MNSDEIVEKLIEMGKLNIYVQENNKWVADLINPSKKLLITSGVGSDTMNEALNSLFNRVKKGK